MLLGQSQSKQASYTVKHADVTLLQATRRHLKTSKSEFRALVSALEKQHWIPVGATRAVLWQSSLPAITCLETYLPSVLGSRCHLALHASLLCCLPVNLLVNCIEKLSLVIPMANLSLVVPMASFTEWQQYCLCQSIMDARTALHCHYVLLTSTLASSV
jgi:hypothetical protein